MKCGCAAQGVRVEKDGSRIPSCLIHDCVEVDDKAPSLEGRQSCCSSMYGPKGIHDVRPSSPELAFFEYKGPWSRHATEMCKCGYLQIAHERGHRCKFGKFTPVGPAQYDKHYCGCMGWD